MFKAGQVVRRLTECKSLAVDGIYEIEAVYGKDEHTDQQIVTLVNNSNRYGACSFVLHDSKGLNNSSKSYNFSVGDTALINYGDIASDLTAENPLALVTVDPRKGGVEYYAVLHTSLTDKIKALSVLGLAGDLPSIICDGNKNLIRLCGVEEFGKLIEFSGRVKRLEWPGKANVSISIPQV